MKPLLTYKDIFRCHCGYSYRHIPKNSGFKWDNVCKLWYTNNIEKAYKLIDYADLQTRNMLLAYAMDNKKFIKIKVA